MRKKEGLAASLTKVGKIWFVFFSRWLAPEACLRHSREKKGKSSKLLLCTKAQDYSSFCPSHPIKDAPRENDEEGHTIAKKEGERQLGSKAKNQEESRECFQYSIVLQKNFLAWFSFSCSFLWKLCIQGQNVCRSSQKKFSNFCKSLGNFSKYNWIQDSDTNFSSPLGTEKCILGFLTVCAILLTDKLFHMKAVIHEGAD